MHGICCECGRAIPLEPENCTVCDDCYFAERQKQMHRQGLNPNLNFGALYHNLNTNPQLAQEWDQLFNQAKASHNVKQHY